MKILADSTPVLVQFKLAGRPYGAANPFEEQTLAPNESLSLADSDELVAARPLVGTAASSDPATDAGGGATE